MSVLSIWAEWWVHFLFKNRKQSFQKLIYSTSAWNERSFNDAHFKTYMYTHIISRSIILLSLSLSLSLRCVCTETSTHTQTSEYIHWKVRWRIKRRTPFRWESCKLRNSNFGSQPTWKLNFLSVFYMCFFVAQCSQNICTAGEFGVTSLTCGLLHYWSQFLCFVSFSFKSLGKSLGTQVSDGFFGYS